MPDLNPNYVNPDYATPEQLKQLRAYSDQLLKGSTENDAKSWAGVAGNLIQGLMGSRLRNQAADMERGAIDYKSQQISPVIQSLLSGGKPDAGQIAAVMQNPWNTEATQGAVRGATFPEKTADVYGNPATTSVFGGVRPQPVAPGYTPGFRGETRVGPEGASMPQAFPAPQGAPQAPQGAPNQRSQAPQAPQGFGGLVQQAIPAINTLSANAAGNEANKQFITQIGQRASDAPNIIKFAGALSDLINANKGKVTWGPGAELSQDIKKGLVNFAPGLGDVLKGPVAATDAIQKMSSSLAPVLARQLGGGQGSDAQLANGLMSVPSLHNSEEGALALSDMIVQSAKKDVEAHNFAMQDPVNARKLYLQYLQDHPVVNPLTGSPIMLDIAKQKFIEKNQGASVSEKPKTVIQNGYSYTLQPDGSYK